MCCLFGLLDHQNRLSGKQKAKVIRALSLEAEARGRDACGIAYNSYGTLQIHKRPSPASRTQFFIPNDARVIMGHTRMTTQINAKFPQNNHPFPGKAGNTRFTLAHDGILYNDKSLRHNRHLPKTNIQTGSYVAVHLLEQLGVLTPDSLKEIAETVKGSFVFTLLDEGDSLYLIKEDNPIAVFNYPVLGLYVYASTQEILRRGANRTWLAREAHRELPVLDGEILRFDLRGMVLAGHFTMSCLPCPLWHPCISSNTPSYQPAPAYLHTLKNIASALGYTPEDIDELLEAGYSTDEIEEELYSLSDCPTYR